MATKRPSQALGFLNQVQPLTQSLAGIANPMDMIPGLSSTPYAHQVGDNLTNYIAQQKTAGVMPGLLGRFLGDMVMQPLGLAAGVGDPSLPAKPVDVDAATLQAARNVWAKVNGPLPSNPRTVDGMAWDALRSQMPDLPQSAPAPLNTQPAGAARRFPYFGF